MIVKQQKTCRTVTTVSWDASLLNDQGIQFAFMSGRLDSVHPLGRTSFAVNNAEVYQGHEGETKELYAQFQRTVAEEANGFIGSTITKEGDDLSETGEPMPAEEED